MHCGAVLFECPLELKYTGELIRFMPTWVPCLGSYGAAATLGVPYPCQFGLHLQGVVRLVDHTLGRHGETGVKLGFLHVALAMRFRWGALTGMGPTF